MAVQYVTMTIASNTKPPDQSPAHSLHIVVVLFPDSMRKKYAGPLIQVYIHMISVYVYMHHVCC